MSSSVAQVARPRSAPPDPEQAPLSFEQLPRLATLRAEALAARPAVAVARARHYTRFFRERGFDPRHAVLQRARALAYVLERLPTPIFDGELLAGSTTEHRLGAMLYPELLGMAILPELPTIARRAEGPCAISEADADELACEIFPFWREHTIQERTRQQGDPVSLQLSERMVLFLLARSNGVSHVIADYGAIVERGLGDLVAETLERERAAPDEEARELLQASRIALEAVIGFAERYGRACAELARRSLPERAVELERQAEILSRVPAAPPRDLHEALQAIWIVHVALHQENSDLALSFGRLDQYLGPIYAADRAAGLSRVRAAEIVGSFFLKMNDHTPLVPDVARTIFGGSPAGQALTIGGLTPAGTDGDNELTRLLLETGELLALREPNICARLHRGSERSYRRALVRSIARTGGTPALYGDEAVVESLVAHGVSLEHARDYGLIGCVEPTSAGRTMGMTGAILFNLAAVLELALHDGVHPLSGLRVGPSTGLLGSFASFDELLVAFCAQLDALVAHACDGNRRLMRAHAEACPTPLLSTLIDGALERGRDVTRGGARYSSSGVAVVGLADVADSLTAVEQLVFAEKRIGPGELAAALRADFRGYERSRALLQSKAPKYGNDDPRADERAVWLVERIAEAFAQHEDALGGRYHVGYWTLTLHTGFGSLTGALPSGRRAGEPLASGATPAAGVARRGPTAALGSTAKLPAACLANGIANNHKLPRQLLEQMGNLDRFARLVEIFFARGGMQVQFTVQDRETLLAAQRHPERYRDLLVRVSGYTAYFSELDRPIQDEIIARAEDRL